jgi:uncharacterized alkaline shock family protein YloU
MGSSAHAPSSSDAAGMDDGIEGRTSVRRKRHTTGDGHERQAVEPRSDVQIAEAIVRAVVELRGVAALGQERVAATYGPGRSVRGVVVRHEGDARLAIDVHVAVSWADTAGPTASLHSESLPSDAASKAALLVLADTIRTCVAATVRYVAQVEPTSVDIYIDDLV